MMMVNGWFATAVNRWSVLKLLVLVTDSYGDRKYIKKGGRTKSGVCPPPIYVHTYVPVRVRPPTDQVSRARLDECHPRSPHPSHSIVSDAPDVLISHGWVGWVGGTGQG